MISNVEAYYIGIVVGALCMAIIWKAFHKAKLRREYMECLTADEYRKYREYLDR